MTTPLPFPRRLLAEGVATALLTAAVLGSGIMAQRLATEPATALLCNTIATAGALVALILAFGNVSGAPMNPVVTLASALRRAQPWPEVPGYLCAQLTGAFAGVMLANAMFALPLVQSSTTDRSQPGLLLGEVVATFALLTTIFGCERSAPQRMPFAVSAIITAGYWFTSSTSFANPAITFARMFTDTFGGIRAVDAPGFVGAQLIGALAALAFDRAIHGKETRS